MQGRVLVLIIGLAMSQPDGEDPPDNSFRNTGFVQDLEHLRGHLKNRIKFDPDKISKDEVEFHFFKIHDLNDDNFLDGIEIMAALRHAYDDDTKRKPHYMDEETWQKTMLQFYIRSVDRILEDDDLNNDGYLTYTEFVNARRAGRILETAQKQKELKEKSD